MILDVLTLYNFRQYHDTQKIYFSQDRTKNVTVVHGDNGSGKTALLGAFLWCLYGTSNLPDPEDVISERAAAETPDGGEVEAFVKLQFSDDARNYSVVRSVRARKSGGALQYYAPVLEVEYIDETGETKIPKNPQDVIEQILPSELRSYFFFDGERMDSLTQKGGFKDIKKAIKILMGLEILERGTNHLEEVRKRFRDESVSSGDSKSHELGDQVRQTESHILAKQQELETLGQNRDALDSELAQVRERLRNLEDSRDLQQRKEYLLDHEAKLKAKIGDVRKRVRSLVSKQGYLAFCREVIEHSRAFLDEKRRKGEIPSGLKKQFIDDLLDRGECICGTPLAPGTQPHHHVIMWREKASSKKLEDAFIDQTGEVKVLAQERPLLFSNLQQLQAEKSQLLHQLTETHEELSQIKAQLEGKDTEIVAELARRERELEDKIRDTDQAIGRSKGDLERLETERRRLEKALTDLGVENAKAQLAKRRMIACDNVQRVIKAILDLQSDDVQQRLQGKISEVYSRMLRKGYEAVIDDNYTLSVNKVMGTERIPVRMSQGERRITSLSFIGALVDIAREQFERDKERTVYFKGGYYPIVMDSPFGELDKDHQERIARGIPGLAHQVIVMASSSQWSEVVSDAMQPFVGREYWLNYRSPKRYPTADETPSVVKDHAAAYEYTAIAEGKHA